MKQIVVQKMTVLFVLLLSACASLDKAAPTLAPAATWPTQGMFSAAGNLYRWDSPTLKYRVQSGLMGATPETALVPLFFGSDGRLRQKSQLAGLRYFKQNATTSAKAVAYLRSIGVTGIYYTTLPTYKRVMSAFSRYSTVLNAYAVIPSSGSTSNISTFSRKAYYFNIYARRSTTSSATGLIPLSAEACATPTFTTAGFPASLGHVGGTVLPGGALLPQQSGTCVANCLAQQTILSTGCLAVIFPFNFVCVIAAGTWGTICVDGCF